MVEEEAHQGEEWVEEEEEQALVVVDVVVFEAVEVGLVLGQTEAAWGVEGVCQALGDELL